MKKQIKKLSLNKKTISNLTAAEMTNLMGGNETKGAECNTKHCYPSVNWCPGTGGYSCYYKYNRCV